MADWFSSPTEFPPPLSSARAAKDLRLLLSERAELLATVERMRAGLETISKRAGQLFERSEKLRSNDARAVRRIADAAARAALTTGEEK
jgi:hypothetical protein